MTVNSTPIEGLLVIQPRIFADDRGFFYESYKKSVLAEHGLVADFVQDNQSFSEKGTLRGLHAQAEPFAQGKLVRVIRGRVWDVAVDIRKNSPTYGKHFGIELSGDNHTQFWIPPGFAHGFVTLEDETIFSYKCTNYYDKGSELGIVWDDATLNLPWPLEGLALKLSPKDKILPKLEDFDSPF